MIYRKEVVSNLPNDFAWYGRDTSRPRQMIDIQYGATIMGGREVSRSYLIWFFAEGERFFSTEPITPPQHNTPPLQKDLRKQIHIHE